LKDVSSKDDGDEATLTEGWKGWTTDHTQRHPSGSFPAKGCRRTQNALPLTGTCMGIRRIKALGKDLVSRLWDYLLGPKVAGLRILRNPLDANSEVRPNGQTGLNYEFQIQNKAFELVRKGNITAVAALEAAMIDQ
jgi:hypothetical protein